MGVSVPPERPSLTWVIVVPSPPETDWPLISSKAVMPAIASRKTAAALTRIGFQGHRETGRPALSTLGGGRHRVG